MNAFERALVLAAGVAGASLAAGDVSADPGAPHATAHVHTSAFRVVTQQRQLVPGHPGVTQTYTGGPLGIEVDVANEDSVDHNDVAVHVTTHDGVDVSQTIALAAKSTKTVSFHDGVGLTSGCHAKTYAITATSAGSTDDQTGEVVPSCKLTTTIRDPWNQAEPDRVADSQKSSAYLTNATLEEATCTAGVKVKARVTNHTKISAASLIVQGKDTRGTVVTQTAAAFPLAAGESKVVELTPANRDTDVPDRLDIAIVDWQKALGGSLVNQGVQVITTKACTLTASLGVRRALH